MAQSPFTWGAAGEKLTPKEVERRRAMAGALAAKAGDTSPVGHWSQGLARVVDALGAFGGNRRADRAEEAGRAQAKSVIDALLGGGNVSMSSMGVPASPASMPVVDGGVGFAGQTPSAPVGDIAERLRMGMIERGLPEHVADGFLMNFQDESGLNPGINEQNPTVPGSRGGFGLYQLTGPRRVAYEQFAQQRGVSPADPDAQLDFLMTELQGPESRAAQSIMAAPDAGTAAAAIARDFLRPAPEHLQRRVAEYTGGQGYTASTMGGGAPQGTSPVMQALLQASTDPWVAQEYGPVLQALMGQEQSRQQFAMEQADPMRQLEIQKAQLEIEQMRNPDAPKPIEVGGVLLDPVTYQPIFDSRQQGGDIPDSVQALDLRAQRAGLTPGTPAYNEFMIAGGSGKGQTINVGGNNDIGTIPAGMMVTRDQAGNVTGMQPIPGGPAEAELRAREAQQAGAQGQKATSGNIVTQDIDRAIALIDQPGIIPTTGMGASLTSSIGGTAGNDLRNLLDTVKANSAFATLAQMRAASPTGGALGAVSDTELGLLTAAQGALDQSQSPQQLKDNLARLNNITLDIVHGPGNGPARKPLSFDEESKKTSATPAMIRTMTLQELSMVPIEQLDGPGLDALEQRFEELSQ